LAGASSSRGVAEVRIPPRAGGTAFRDTSNFLQTDRAAECPGIQTTKVPRSGKDGAPIADGMVSLCAEAASAFRQTGFRVWRDIPGNAGLIAGGRLLRYQSALSPHRQQRCLSGYPRIYRSCRCALFARSSGNTTFGHSCQENSGSLEQKPCQKRVIL